MKRLFWLLCSILFSTHLLSQDFSPQPSITIKKVITPIVMDGKLTDAIWSTAEAAQDFWLFFPTDSLRAQNQTEIYFLYDANNLYVGIKCYAPTQNYVTPSLRRDYRARGNDNITIMFDPFEDGNNAFVFGINPFGVRREALVVNGGRNPGDDFDESWDNKWNGEASIGDGYWSAELAIPFSTLRFNEGSKTWGFQSYRFDTQSNTWSVWNRVPQNQSFVDLGFMGNIIWEEPLKKSGTNISVIPYVSGGLNRELDPEAMPADLNYGIGMDAKFGITPGLNLDLTANPDFSQVEVDRQVTNLSRFEIFFPERRQFFLENADLFGGFGSERINPFFSRRIGVSYDTIQETNVQNPILLGARLSGKLDKNWRIGLLSMQTARDQENGLPSYNYTVAAVQRKIFSRSNLGFIMVNKQSLEDAFDEELYNPFNRVVGVDYNLATPDSKWAGKTFFHHSISPDQPKAAYSHGARLQYNRRSFNLQWSHQLVGEGYDAEVGFVPRTNFFRIRPEGELKFYDPDGYFVEHGPGIQTDFLWTPEVGKTDHQIELYYDFNFKDNARGRITVQNEYTYLLDPFDPTRVGEESDTLPGLTGYHYTSLRAFYSSDRRKKVFFTVFPSAGQFFNGNRYSMRGSITYRYQPFGSLELNFNYNYIDLPNPFQPTTLILFGPRVDLTFSKSLFLTTFIQFNNQIDNINVNARLQWRFAPVSDLFLVYTDNYYSTDLRTKNRAIIAKFTYWLNI